MAAALSGARRGRLVARRSALLASRRPSATLLAVDVLDRGAPGRGVAAKAVARLARKTDRAQAGTRLQCPQGLQRRERARDRLCERAQPGPVADGVRARD